MRVVVTGGSGFIGTHLVRLLQERRLSVGIVDIRPPQLDNVAGVEYLPVDIRQRQALRGLFKEAKVVYHLAGNPQLWTRRKGQFGQVNYCGTVHVLDEALTAGVPRLVHVSTESILTRTDQQDLIREDQDVPCREVLG
ncbi:MAG: NAD-dependent epimerase/dehydratase family protein, partial [Gemmataceae bacterium]|nr:NAD-dependent epimerase/dehydratase family protein [Gemmataceae bacterium]